MHATRFVPLASRRGLTTPLVAAALLVGMIGMALVLDRLWLEAARVELTTAAEAAALAAAQQLASDDRLRDPRISGALAPSSTLDEMGDPIADPLQRAREVAGRVAAENLVAGQPVVLDTSAGGDVRFGQLVAGLSAGNSLDDIAVTEPQSESDRDRLALVREQFVESDNDPTHVVVFAQRTRFRGNPVALFVGELTGATSGNVFARAEAGLDNRIVGIRPLPDVAAPAVPLAIWKRDPSGQRVDTWEAAIEQRRGADQYSYDETTQTVERQSDGIPELRLKTPRVDRPQDPANFQVLDLGTQFEPTLLAQQWETGWERYHLAAWNGELRLGAGRALAGRPQLAPGDQTAIDSIVGQPRIALLYSRLELNGREFQVVCTDFVAIRILAISALADGGSELIVQPTVLTTRSALTPDSGMPLAPINGDDMGSDTGDAPANRVETDFRAASGTNPAPAGSSGLTPNRYIYRLRLTQ